MNITINQNAKEFLRAEGRSIILLQDPSELTFTRSDNNLLISTAGGDEALVEDFFVLDEGTALPVFVVGAGESIKGADFLSAMNPQLGLETAAGPASSTAQGSGSGEYSDAAGDLIDGLDRLGSLGTSHWDMSLDTTELLLSDSSLLGEASGSSLTPPVDPLTPDIPKDFFVRGVMYNDGNTDDFVAINIFFPNGDGLLDKLRGDEVNFSGQNPSARYQVEIGTPDGWDKSWVDISYNSLSGRMEFTLTAEGLAEMQRLELESYPSPDIKNLFDFITVEVVDSNNPENVFGYLVEIVVGDTSRYFSDNQNYIDHTEGYPVDGKELIGEYHHAKGQDGPYFIVSSNKNDELIFNDRLSGSNNINSGSYDESGSYPMAGGSDTIFLNKGMEGSYPGAHWSTITAHRGTVIALSDSEDVLFGSNNASNTIWAKNIEIKGSASGKSALYAEDGAKNSLNSFESGGKIIVSGFYGLQAFSDGKNLISISDGPVEIKGSEGGYAMYAHGGGYNSIASHGSSVISTSGNVLAIDSGQNSILNYAGKYIGDGSHIAKDGGGTMITATGIEISGLVKSENTLSAPPTWSTLDAGNDGSVKLSGGLESIGKGALVRIIGGDVSIKAYQTAVRADKGDIDITGNTVFIGTNEGSSTPYVSAVTNKSFDSVISIEARDHFGILLSGYAKGGCGVASYGTTTIKSGGDIDITLKNGSFISDGIRSYGGGTINLEAENNINIKVKTVTSASTAADIKGSTGIKGEGTNNINTKNGNILVVVDEGESSGIGILASYGNFSGGVNNITALEGKVTVQVTGTDKAAIIYGIRAAGSGVNDITAKDMDVKVHLDGGKNYEGDLSAIGITAYSHYDASGKYAKNVINVSGKLLVDVSSDASAGGIAVRGKSGGLPNSIITAGELELIVKSTGEVSGSRAVGLENTGGINTVFASEKATINVSGKDLAAAFYNTGSGQQNLTVGGDLTVNVNSSEGEAFGMSGKADIYASSVTMTIKGDLSTIIMDGKGTITADTINLTAESAHGTSYAMYNDGSASNIIQSKPGHALNLEINADHAMDASSGKNSIIGNSVRRGAGDSINLNGDIYQSGAGSNSVQTGSGDDTITINGDIYQSGTGRNSLQTGLGNDTITINGVINGAGAIHIDGGSGYDTLILKADSAADFITKYGAWLNGLSTDILIGIENIEFSGIEDLSKLSSALGDFFDYIKDAGIRVNGQPIEDLLASSAAFAAEALEESALSGQDGESQDADSSATYAASIAEFDFSDLLRDGESEGTFELSMGKIYSDESLSNESIFQNVTESVDIADMIGVADTNANEQSLDALLGGIEEYSSQKLQAEVFEELATTMPPGLTLAETTAAETAGETPAETAAATLAVASPSAFVGANTDAFRSADEGSEQDVLIQLDILSNFN